MKVAKEGYPFIIFFIVFGILIRKVSRVLSNISYILAGFCAFFFRDPDREFTKDENKIISPADGTVIGIDECYESDYIKGDVYKVSIFMSVFNVHINRAPISGVVDFISYRKGNFEAAFKPQASFDNEMNLIGIQNEKIKLLIKQIAGVLARRIVCDVTIGDNIIQTNRFGMIKFGSRVEILIPKRDDIKLNVTLAEKVYAGQTVIAELIK